MAGILIWQFDNLSGRGLFKNESIATEESSTRSWNEAVNTEISSDVLEQLQEESDSATYELQVNRLKNLITALDVHEKFKQEVERLIKEGHSLPDVLIAYEFLYQSYGRMQDLEPLIKQKEDGKEWDAVFTDYNRKHETYVPRSFDSEYLEGLLKTPGVTPDDIMLADRLSFVTDTEVKDILEDRLESDKSWKQIAVELNVLNGSSSLPRVQITEEELAAFSTDTFTEDNVAEAFVLAQKLAETPESVVELMQAGKSEEAIMAASYSHKYSS
ncbi:hypothetical protein E6C55_32710 [Cohnella fermenti]|uniref:Uncharacterized protein n=1 Tax=Cohnella fermenti TaxID=2565925 RepID=A0A4S4BEH6_9BACL|nr:hypothetical protein E6C55_32710 [Cohnella fermenti]